MSLPPPRSEVERDKVSHLSAEPEDVFQQQRASSPAIKTQVKTSHGVGEDRVQYLQQPTLDSFYTSDTQSNLSAVSLVSDGRNGRTSSYLPLPGQRHLSLSPAPARPTTWKGKWQEFWQRNRGLALVLLSQFFGALMNVSTRLLETSGDQGSEMHPLQIIFVRMIITVILSTVYMYYEGTPDFPFGSREVRVLLVFRGVGGFFGVFGIYFSLKYLPIAEATVITFLAPVVACFACAVLIHEPFTRIEQIAGLVSLLGVVLIARPTTLFSSPSTPPPVGTRDISGASTTNGTHTGNHGVPEVTPIQRLTAVCVALVGVLGAACAYTTIRWIGKRAHPLISVNYFATWSTIVATVGLLVLPDISFKLPVGWREWGLLFFLGTCGFIMQFLLTAGLAHEKSSRATNMVYTQMLFALFFDKLIFNTAPGLLSIIGSSLILGSAVYVAVHREKDKGSKERAGSGGAGGDEERGGLIDGIDAGEEGEGGERGVQEVQLRTLRV